LTWFGGVQSSVLSTNLLVKTDHVSNGSRKPLSDLGRICADWLRNLKSLNPVHRERSISRPSCRLDVGEVADGRVANNHDVSFLRAPQVSSVLLVFLAGYDMISVFWRAMGNVMDHGSV